jgi:hypothetical protein
MTTEVTSPSARARIVVAVDAPRYSRPALEAAVALAANMSVEVEALFVEDEGLLGLADLPFTREVDRASGTTRELDSRRMARAMRAEAELLRRVVTQIAEASSVSARVRVVRGRYETESLSAASRVDVAFLYRARRAAEGGQSSAGGSAERRIKPIWTVFDRTPQSARAVALAARLAGLLERKLVALLPILDSGAASRQREEAEALLASAPGGVRYASVDSSRASHLAEALAREGGSLLVLSKESRRYEDFGDLSRLQALAIPLVLVA